MKSQRLRIGVVVVAGVLTLAGCVNRKDVSELHYLGPDGDAYYKNVATKIDYPDTETERPEQVVATADPHTLTNLRKDQIWDLSLAQTLQMALANNRIIRVAAQFTTPGNGLMTNPNTQESVYDSALQESGVLFGGRGVEAALADFDTQLAVSTIFGYNSLVSNNASTNVGVTPGMIANMDTAAYNASLTKTFANGGQITLSNVWNYLNTNSPAVLFPSSYSGYVRVGYTQPLWAGSGVEYTRIASPLGTGPGAITGVSQGVVIARINEDMALSDFELSVLTLLRDTEYAYWNLYLQYRLFHTAVVAHNSALLSWREAHAKLVIGGVTGFTPVDEATARDQVYSTRATAEQTLTNLYTNETNLRRLIGLPVNDGRVIRPVDEPLTAKFVPDWYNSLTDGLTRRVELRKQKWAIKSLELQLKAARSLVAPQLNFVSYYQVNGFGNDLMSQQSEITQPFSSREFGSLAEAQQTGWNLGFQASMPIGFRSAHAQVRNYELRVAKVREGLATQEMEVAQELAVSFQNVAAAYQTAQSNFNRRIAAERSVALYQSQYEIGTTTLSFVLQAQSSLASAESNYYTSLASYAQAIMDLNFRKGTLLDYHNVSMAESEWTPEAYKDAERRAWARSHAIPANCRCTEPAEFELAPGAASPETIRTPAGAEAAGPAVGTPTSAASGGPGPAALAPPVPPATPNNYDPIPQHAP